MKLVLKLVMVDVGVIYSDVDCMNPTSSGPL